jgi:hypothetical protein
LIYHYFAMQSLNLELLHLGITFRAVHLALLGYSFLFLRPLFFKKRAY